MTLKELIHLLKLVDTLNPDTFVSNGFDDPHSYRGYYDELSFEPSCGTRVSKLIEVAQSAIGQTYPGHKGGMYTMTLDTPVHLAREGQTHDFDDPNNGFGALLIELALALASS